MTGGTGLRVLCVSVRGHRHLVGAPGTHTLDADEPVPPDVGRRFASVEDVERFTRQELRGLSSYWRVEVVDDDGVVVLRGTRSGPGGTGERWTWQPA